MVEIALIIVLLVACMDACRWVHRNAHRNRLAAALEPVRKAIAYEV